MPCGALLLRAEEVCLTLLNCHVRSFTRSSTAWCKAERFVFSQTKPFSITTIRVRSPVRNTSVASLQHGSELQHQLREGGKERGTEGEREGLLLPGMQLGCGGLSSLVRLWALHRAEMRRLAVNSWHSASPPGCPSAFPDLARPLDKACDLLL